MTADYEIIEDGLHHPADAPDGLDVYALVRYRRSGVYGMHAAEGRVRSVDQHWALRQHIIAVRRASGLSQEAAARQCNVSTSAWQAWEAGRRNPAGLYRQAIDRWLANAPTDIP